MKKKSLLLLGLVTLLVFPIPAFIGLYFIEGITPIQVMQFNRMDAYPIALGIIAGMLYAVVALGFMMAPVFEKLPTRIETVIAKMRLNTWHCLFLSLCAGVGEEILFRSGIQYFIGPIITSILFVAIHGYLNPFNWRISLYGIIVLPFIFLLSYALDEFGLWFCIGAHFSYDFVLFYIITHPIQTKTDS